jgi:hypothetical protein
MPGGWGIFRGGRLVNVNRPPDRLCLWICFALLAGARLAMAEPAAPAEPRPGTVADWRETGSFAAPEAHQAAAADERYVYAITNRVVAQYDRKTHQRVGVSKGAAEHLNSGFVFEDKVYCAHSNYPQSPEISEIKVFDPTTRKLTTFRDFGDFGGSLTWAVHHDGHWWCNFAKYGDDNGATFLVKFDDQWRERERWTYPAELIQKLGAYSLSGGLWREGELLATDHDHRRLYRLRLPAEGRTMVYLGQVAAPFTGQGFAHDPVTGGLVGIDRAQKKIIFASPSTSAR